MTVLYLTNNPQLAGTARILTSWITLGREADVKGCAAVQRPGQLTDWLREHDVPFTVSPMPWLNRRWPVPALREAWRLARWARRQGASIVHCNEHDVYPFGALVAALMRVPVVCHIRFSVEREFCQWAFGGWRRPDALLWTTNQQRQDCRAAIQGVVDERRQHLIPLGPDLAAFRGDTVDRAALRRSFDIREGEIVIGTATALRPVKRIEDFVQLVTVLADRYPAVVGLIAGGAVVGDEAYRADIERRIAESGLGRRLRWLGHIEPIAPLLQSLDVFVSTSEYETFGNSVCEAMACRLPVAAYVGGSVHEIIGETGAVLPNGDIAGLTGAVERLIKDPAARVASGARGQARVAATFNPRVSFRRLREVYRHLNPPG